MHELFDLPVESHLPKVKSYCIVRFRCTQEKKLPVLSQRARQKTPVLNMAGLESKIALRGQINEEGGLVIFFFSFFFFNTDSVGDDWCHCQELQCSEIKNKNLEALSMRQSTAGFHTGDT